MALASLCVTIACVGGYSAYNHYNNNLVGSNLLSENVEALSQGDAAIFGTIVKGASKWCGWIGAAYTCYEIADAIWGNHTEWVLQSSQKQCSYYPNGHIKEEHYVYTYQCCTVDGWGSNTCTLGSFNTVRT